MSDKIRKSVICNGCFEELDAPTRRATRNGESLDLCDECAEKGMYICGRCWEVHAEDEECPNR
jgi:hypothetical protein